MSAERDPGQWWVRFGHGVDQPACEWGPYIGTGPRKDGA